MGRNTTPTAFVRVSSMAEERGRILPRLDSFEETQPDCWTGSVLDVTKGPSVKF